MVGFFGVAEAGVVHVFFAVDVAEVGVAAEHLGGVEFVDGLAGTGDAVVGFFDVSIEGVADDFADGEGGDGAVAAAEEESFEGIR